MKFKFYKKSFKNKKPPAPPNRTIRTPGVFSMGGETKESKRQTSEYRTRLLET